MTELIILSLLLEGNYTIYRIKKQSEKLFSVCLKLSFGTIYPAVKKLELKKLVTLNEKFSDGGQKSSVYSITEEGKLYFRNLMFEELPENPSVAEQLINVKLLLLDKLAKEDHKVIIDSIIRYYELKMLIVQNRINFLAKKQNNSIQSNLKLKFFEHHLDKISDEVNWLNSLLF